MQRIAVLRGGTGEHHEDSLKTGGDILTSLRKQDGQLKDIVITKQGEWLESGIAKTANEALSGIDKVFLALHGEFGESGQIQRYLKTHNIPFTGSAAMATALTYNKHATKQLLKGDVLTPKHVLLQGDSLWSVANMLDEIAANLGDDLFLKPVSGGFSHDAQRVVDKTALENTLEVLLSKYGQVLVEEYIQGREATVGILENFRNEEFYALPAVEVHLPQTDFFHTKEAKRENSAKLVCPSNFTYEQKQILAETAVRAHQNLNCSQYTRSDFIINDAGVYFLETNALPSLNKQSPYVKAAQIVGLEYDGLIAHLLHHASA